MTDNKFRYNKKRKHYSYSFRKRNGYSENILLTTDSVFENKKYGKRVIRHNIPIAHPNPRRQNDGKTYYIVNHSPYIDKEGSFYPKEYHNWKWRPNDKRKVKRFKKYKKNKRYFDTFGK